MTEAQKVEIEKAKRRQMLAEKLHFWVFALVERLQKGATEITPNETKFVREGKAEIQIQLTAKTPEVIEKLKLAGFEVADDKNAKFIIGKIAIEKLASLAEITEVQYVLPNVK